MDEFDEKHKRILCVGGRLYCMSVMVRVTLEGAFYICVVCTDIPHPHPPSTPPPPHLHPLAGYRQQTGILTPLSSVIPPVMPWWFPIDYKARFRSGAFGCTPFRYFSPTGLVHEIIIML